jgi:hypothetical protein
VPRLGGLGDGIVAVRADRLRKEHGSRRRRLPTSTVWRDPSDTSSTRSPTASGRCRPTVLRSRSRTAGRSSPTCARSSVRSHPGLRPDGGRAGEARRDGAVRHERRSICPKNSSRSARGHHVVPRTLSVGSALCGRVRAGGATDGGWARFYPSTS